MVTKNEIYELINQDKLFNAFEELKIFFGNGNVTFNALRNKYITPPDNFDKVAFINQLKTFVSFEYAGRDKSRITDLSVDEYDLLCDFDFTRQTKNFKSIYQYKNISAFLLHGETDEDGSDLRWL